jgi:hypothetical protein
MKTFQAMCILDWIIIKGGGGEEPFDHSFSTSPYTPISVPYTSLPPNILPQPPYTQIASKVWGFLCFEQMLFPHGVQIITSYQN